MTNKARLAVVVFAPVYFDGSCYTTDATFQLMLEPLCQSGMAVDLCAPLVRSPKAHREPIPRGVRLIALPGFTNGREKYFTRLHKLIFGCLWVFLRHRRDWGLVWIVDADIHSQWIYVLARLFRRESFLYVRGREDLQTLRAGMTGRRRWLGWALGWWISVAVRHMARHIPLVVTGKELYRLYSPDAPCIHSFTSSLVRAIDILTAPIGTRPSSELVVLSVGRVAPIKGIDTIVEALGRLRFDMGVRLVVVGPVVEVYWQEIDRLAGVYGIRDRLTRMGQIPFGPELWSTYRAADIFVQASRSEGTPKSVVEAMAAGLPIVATTVGSLPDLVRDGENGILVSPDDPVGMAAAIATLAASKELRQAMGARSRAFAAELVLDGQLDRLFGFLRSSLPRLRDLGGLAKGT